MEFFGEVANRSVTADQVCELVNIQRLPELCASIDAVLSVASADHGEIYCLWGQFQVARQRIRNGVRLALLNCPHALAWTVAVREDANAVVVHCTIDDREAESEFVETIEQFVSDWTAGLGSALPASAAKTG
jgi:hypothetical protein